MTNGEKIQQMFPRKCPHIGFNENFGRIWLMQDGEDFANFTLKWWNAEYKEPTNKNEAKYCDRNICLKNEYNNIGCEDCEVTKSQEPTIQECQAESDKIDAAFHDGYNHGYAQARFDYEQEPRKGHWGWLRCDMYVCSECENVYTDLSGIKDGMNYCSNCGADMREVEE